MGEKFLLSDEEFRNVWKKTAGAGEVKEPCSTGLEGAGLTCNAPVIDHWYPCGGTSRRVSARMNFSRSK